MLKFDENNTPVHYPEDSGKFQFDGEVARIFDNMASRAIPFYKESHRLAAVFVLDRINDIGQVYDICSESGKNLAPVAHILDIGCSTGAFFSAIYEGLGMEPTSSKPNVLMVGLDSSQPMIDQLNKNLPEAYGLCADVLEKLPRMDDEFFDVVNISYVIQFIPVARRAFLIKEISRVLKPGGLLIISGKYKPVRVYCEVFDSTYRQFRLNHGYSKEEIDRKTEALKGSMWVEARHHLYHDLVNNGFKGIQDIAQWMHFSTLVATKPEVRNESG